jgi:histidinol-phosphate aminotransferase
MKSIVDSSALEGLSRRQWLQMGSLALAGLSLGQREALGAPPAAAPAGPIRLTLNENPFGPSPRAVAAISRQLAGLSRYTETEAAALARQIAAYENVPAEHIVLGEILEPLGLQLGLRGGPGGQFIYSVPGYNALVDAARPVGGESIGVPLDADLRNDLPALRSRINPRTRALFLVNPHNPSGTVHPPRVFLDFAREASRQALVIVDEAYLEFTDNFAASTATALVRAGENVIVFRTFSKAYGLAALPFGYAVAPRALAAELTRAGVGEPRSLNRLALVAAGAALADQSFLDTVRAQVKAERSAWFALLRELGLRWADSRGNFVFFETRRPHGEFAAALLARGVDIGRAFPPLDTWARISIGLPEENAAARSAVRQVLKT